MGYEGLIITDALDMKGVTSYFPTGTIEVKALLAGNDILLLSADVPKAIKQLKKAVKDGRIPEEKIDERCHKILIYKYRAGLHEWAPVEVRGLYQDLNSPQSAALNRSLFEEAITLVKNNDEILPLERLDTLLAQAAR